MISWSVVAKELAKGALSGAGGMAFEKFVGNNALSDLIDQALSEVDRIVKTRIAENELRKLRLDIEATQVEFQSYLAAPSGFDRLESATSRITQATVHLESFGINAYSSYFVAVSLWLAILSERRKVFAEDGPGLSLGSSEWRNQKLIAARGIAHSRQLIADWQALHRSRYRVVPVSVRIADPPFRRRRRRQPLPPTPPPIPRRQRRRVVWLIFLDGQPFNGLNEFRSQQDAEEKASKLRIKDWEENIYSTTIGPSLDTLRDWHAFASLVGPFRRHLRDDFGALPVMT